MSFLKKVEEKLMKTSKPKKQSKQNKRAKRNQIIAAVIVFILVGAMVLPLLVSAII